MAKRLIDANALIEEYIKLEYSDQSMGIVCNRYMSEIARVGRQPTVDAVEVVRCGDCKYWTWDGNGYMDDEPHCGNAYGIEGYPTENDFCSRGERRTE